jgi:precorrin-8X/cobalt-precorrin-8 methylmutase
MERPSFPCAEGRSSVSCRRDGPSLDAACSPQAIEARSFAIIDAEAGENKPFTGQAWQIARRLVHACGDLSLLDSLYLPERAIAAGLKALKEGAPLFTDTEMVRAGIPRRRMEPFGVPVVCLLSRPGLAEHSRRLGITRSRAGIEAAGPLLGGAIVAIGNAPTALLALLDYVDSGGKPPALVIGMPVGFVNAAESKELLIRRSDFPSLAVRGRRGGSPLAAATVNALACLAGEEAGNAPA